MTVYNMHNTPIDFNAAIQLMDDDLREELHISICPCTNQEFFAAYEQAHLTKYGEPFILSESNPTW